MGGTSDPAKVGSAFSSFCFVTTHMHKHRHTHTERERERDTHTQTDTHRRTHTCTHAVPPPIRIRGQSVGAAAALRTAQECYDAAQSIYVCSSFLPPLVEHHSLTSLHVTLLTHSHSLTHSLTHTHTLTHSLTHSLTHTLTHSHNHTHRKLKQGANRMRSRVSSGGALRFGSWVASAVVCG